MGERVKRNYSSARRAAQAKATRRAILDAAADLFVAQGYAATTIHAIAQRADVAVQTVYAVFGNKRELVRQLIENAITGDDDPTPVTQRAESLAIAAEPDPRRRAQLDAAMSRAITERVAPTLRAAREAAASAPEPARTLEPVKANRRTEMLEAVTLLAGPQGPHLATEQAAATLYVLYSPDVADMLIGDYGWSPEQYEEWLATMIHRTLLADHDRDASPNVRKS